MLPCWDEPARKASFTVAIDAPKDRMAVSNMPVAGTTSLSATMQRVRFAESPKMSTYLLFVAVGDFEVDGMGQDLDLLSGEFHEVAPAGLSVCSRSGWRVCQGVACS